MKSTPVTYRTAALDHINAAETLWDSGLYVLANYTAGLAAECILRAYAVRHSEANWNVAHHDLRLWYREAKFDLLLPASKRDVIGAARSTLQLNWENRQRYSSLDLLKAEFKRKNLDRGIRGDFVKEVTRNTIDAAREIVSLGARQWTHFNSKFKPS